ncbi:MAG: flagellar motor protein [Myxococcales bacterium]|nr:flagellar motor protein [Myxococcales bacterium]
MDIGLVIGIIWGFAAILLGNTLEHGALRDVVGGPAALIVIGGTLGAVLVNFPIDTLKVGLKQAGAVFKKPAVAVERIIGEIVDLATLARREGILGLEKKLGGASEPFLVRALTMAIDGAEASTIRETMETVIANEEEEAEHGAKVFEAAGGFAPTVGIIGAVLGLIQVMKNLSDMEAVGRGIATAFIATIYGVAFANLVCLPLAGRIKVRAQRAAKLKDMMLQGVLAIQDGTNPKLVRDRLNSYFSAHEQAKADKGKVEAAEAKG